MDTEDTETESVIRESEDRESQIQEESEGIAGETFTENDVETETGIEIPMCMMEKFSRK